VKNSSNVNSPSITWKIHWPLTAFVALLLPCLLGLGYWQVQRAEQKRVMLAQFEQRRDSVPIELAQLPAQPELYTRVSVTGAYDNEHSFLLDNRISRGRFGYEIITPLRPTGATRALLVDRGWIEGDPSRLQRPVIAAVEGTVTLTGYVYRESEHVQLVANILNEQRWPKLIQSLRVEDLQAQLGVTVFPFIVRIDAAMPGAQLADWQIVFPGFGPERHTAYAVTWFAMAATLVVMWLLLSSNLWSTIKGSSR
jgi:surfeit locus 1 family protein